MENTIALWLAIPKKKKNKIQENKKPLRIPIHEFHHSFHIEETNVVVAVALELELTIASAFSLAKTPTNGAVL